jgi:hypothetical protein
VGIIRCSNEYLILSHIKISMNSDQAFVIKADNGEYFSLQISKVFGFPIDTVHWGGYDTLSLIEIKTRYFTAKGEIFITTGELYLFYCKLNECYLSIKGIAELTSYEENLNLKLSFDPSGRISVAGSLVFNTENGTQLNFQLHGDQSYLPETIQGLKRITDYYGNMEGKK